MRKVVLCLIVLMVFIQSEAIAKQSINEIPMYGENHKPKIKYNVKLSQSATKLGWKYYYQGDLNTAMKRFNQGWALNPENPEVYWGFGLIMGQRAYTEKTEKNLMESIRFLNIAVKKKFNDGRILGDLAFSHTIIGYYFKFEKKDTKKAKEHFESARQLFPKAFRLNSKYPPIVANWSIFYFYTEDYKKAKDKASEAVKMGYKFNPDYINNLKSEHKLN